MNNKLQKYDAYEVLDPTDWLETPLRSLSAVDAALRCQVCKDFYTTPMITSCSHTFCSLCIRRCLNNDGKCPACRTTDQELKLRFNGVMEDLVEGFKKARPEVFAFATKPVAPAEEKSPKRRREKSQTVEGDEEPVRKRTRSTRQTRSTQETVIVDTDEEDADFIPEDGYVQCPICSKSVKETSINSHIDRGCPDEPPKFKVSKKTSMLPAKGKAPGKRPERLAQLHYGTMKDNVLRKKLAEHNIPTWGTRQEMQRRFTEWVTLWNANCDATHPKSKGELKSELDVWERTQGAHAQHSSLNPGTQIRSKEFDRDAWSNQNDDSFKQLIADARKKAQESKKLLESRPKSPVAAPLVSGTPEAPLSITHSVQDNSRKYKEDPNSAKSLSLPDQLSLQAELFREADERWEREKLKNSSSVKQYPQAQDPIQQKTPTRNESYGTHNFEPDLRNRGHDSSNTYNGNHGSPNKTLLPEEITRFYEHHPLPDTNSQLPSTPNGTVRGFPGMSPGPKTSNEYPSPSKFSYGFGDGGPYYGGFQ